MNNRENSDPDAKWGYSTTKEWVFGYKVHLVCDAELELPLAFTVTPANVYDNQECFTLLSKIAKGGIKFEYVIADAGYDTKDNYYLISHIYHAVPIIAMNRRNLKKSTREFESYLPIKRDTDLWKSLYQKRGAVERVFSRLKEELALKMVKVRGINNMKTHVATSLITMICVALVAIKSGNINLSKSVNSFKY
ncbi:MAG: transposase [Candidatus Bathyarchaeia archaeon]|nr:transposase [Candidatus Bathyarchaeota archaeon A05DMB-3]